jgi:hypothetical protein
MSDFECPYCGAEGDINHDDGYGYDEGDTHNQMCRHCEKTFVYTTSISFYYEVEQADCLNGAPHHFKKTKTFPPEYVRLRCEVCGEEKSLGVDDAKD